MRAAILSTVLLMLPLSLACGDKDAGDSGASADGGSADGGSGDGGDGGAAGTARLTGKAVFPDGSPANVQMRLCEELCRSEWTEKDGTFEYVAVEAGHYAFEAVYLEDQKAYATPLDFLTIADDQQIDLATDVIVYPFGTVHDLTGGAEDVTVDGGLTITVDPSGMTASSANSPVLSGGESDYVAAVSVDPDALGLPLEEIQGEVVAAWFMGRMSVTLSPFWSFTSSDAYGLADGESVRILAADYDTKQWLDGGTATVTGGVLASDDGAGIPALSTLLFVKE